MTRKVAEFSDKSCSRKGIGGGRRSNNASCSRGEMLSAATGLSTLRSADSTPAAGPGFRRAEFCRGAVGCTGCGPGGRVDRRSCFFRRRFVGLPATVVAALSVATTVFVTGALHEDGLSDMRRRLRRRQDPRTETQHHARQPHRHLWGGRALVFHSAALERTGRVRHPFARPLCSSRGPRRRARHDADVLYACCRLRALTDFPQGPARSGNGRVFAALSDRYRNSALSLGFNGTIFATIVLALRALPHAPRCERQIGGQTGDVLGAVEQLSEITVLLIACAIFN